MKKLTKKDKVKMLGELRKRVIEKNRILKENNETKELLKANKEALLEMTELSKEDVNQIEIELLDNTSKRIFDSIVLQG